MKQTIKTSRAAGQLEKMFRAINRDLFAGEVEEPIITIQSTPGAHGHVTVGKTWERKDGEWHHELNISAETMSRPIEEVCATLIHEMTHLINIQRGVQDCSRGGTYHNRKFRDEAEKHLIHIEKHEKYGWTLTTPTEELLEYIISQGWEDLQMSRGYGLSAWKPTGTPKTGDGASTDTGDTEKKKSSSRKYVCPCCGLIVRATKVVRVMCMECSEELMEVEK